MGAPFHKLTEAQRECLRLVYMRWQISEIAGKFNISIGAVNQRLKLARQTLGVASSLEAARLLAEFERLPVDYIPTTSMRNTVVPDELHDAGEGPAENGEVEAGWPTWHEMREPQARYLGPTYHQGWLRWPVPSQEGAINDFTVPQILFWVVAIALAAGSALVVIIGVALSIQDAISRF